MRRQLDLVVVRRQGGPEARFDLADTKERRANSRPKTVLRDLIISYRRYVFGGDKAPAGAHLVAPSLESTCFVYLRNKNQDSLFS